MRTLAASILGTRRVGLAMSDEGGKYATPLEVLQITAPEQATGAILSLIEREGVERIVLGLPLNMDDSIGPQAAQAAAWGKDLAEKSGKPVILVDERLSSFEAEQQLNQRRRGGEKLTRKRKKSAVGCHRRRRVFAGVSGWQAAADQFLITCRPSASGFYICTRALSLTHLHAPTCTCSGRPFYSCLRRDG